MSYVFDGDDYLTASIVVNNAAGGVSMWVKRTVDGGINVLFDSDAARHQYVAVDDPAHAFTSHIAGTGFTYETGAQLGGSWQHLLLAWNEAGASSTIYLDGTALPGTGAAYADSTVPSMISIATRYQFNNSFFVGKLAEFALFGATPSQADATALAGGASPQTRLNLTHYNRLNADLLATVGGVTLTAGGAPAADGADNPTVLTFSSLPLGLNRRRRLGSGAVKW